MKKNPKNKYKFSCTNYLIIQELISNSKSESKNSKTKLKISFLKSEIAKRCTTLEGSMIFLRDLSLFLILSRLLSHESGGQGQDLRTHDREIRLSIYMLMDFP